MCKTVHSLLVLCALLAIARTPSFSTPKFVVVLVVDQLPYDWLVRFNEYYGENGFRYLMKNGADFSNASYKHALNKTAPGHAVIMTGCYANVNGIIANRWYDPVAGRDVYCVADPGATMLAGSGDGKSSLNLVVPTFGDQLRLHTGFVGKVVSIAQKDRSAILLGGKMPSAAVWMSDTLFVSSSYYGDHLPSWVTAFNASGRVTSYRGKTWKRTLPDAAFRLADADDVPYESDVHGLGRAFPHPIEGKDPQSYNYALLSSPYGLDVLNALVMSAVKSEQLGKRDVTDLLCVSFATPDYVGHTFGPNSREVMEIAVHTDRAIAELLQSIDDEVGLSNTIVVLTSDHGVTPIPEYLQSKLPNVDAGRVSRRDFMDACNNALQSAFGAAPQNKNWVKRLVDMNLYLDRDVLKEKQLDLALVSRVLADSINRFPSIALALPKIELLAGASFSPLAEKMRRSFHHERSGDVVLAYKPFYSLDDEPSGAEHGNPYEYDAHVPVILMGEGINPGRYVTEASPVDIAPTLSALLGIELPPGREGRVLHEALARER